jgi:hypothetical protein
MSTSAISPHTSGHTPPATRTIHTTLYDLIAAINEEVAPQEDHLVTATVVHLMNSGRVKFTDDTRQLRAVCP